jgi:two-component system, OmpR family, sensor histidine kinase VicK
MDIHVFHCVIAYMCAIVKQFVKTFYINSGQSRLHLSISSPGTNTKKTRILFDVQNTNRAILQLISKSKSEVDICDNYIMQAIERELFKKALSDAKDRGVRLKCIIEITKENIDYCKELMELVEIRHLDGLKANFILNKTKCLSITTTTTAMQERKTVPQIVYIDIMQIVEQYHQIFDTLWNKTTITSAQDRIKEIEGRRVKPFTLDIIQDPKCAESLFITQIQQARSEVLIAVSSILELERLATIGLVDSIKRANRRGVSMMILHSEEEQQESRNDGATQSQLISNIKRCAQIKSISGIQGIILLIDNSKVLTMSDKDDGLASIAVYSDNKSLAKNFGSLLDSLWNETEMLESIIVAKDDLADLNKQLAEANEQLKIHARMQREFIDVAAHELRTPIQSILGYAELLEEDTEAEEAEKITIGREGGVTEIGSDINNKRNSVKAVIRNAKRLEQLSQLILDVTKIENKSLNLRKELLNLNDIILTAIDDLIIYTAKDSYKKDNYTKLRYEPIENDVFIDADKSRLTQVIFNLLRNAVKFTKEGIITIKAEKKEDHVLVSIKDTGSGIDPEIMPRLFTKFATKSEEGTGLGLFISKGIVEAHGGRIWAENSEEREKRGAVFTFSLPLTKK